MADILELDQGAHESPHIRTYLECVGVSYLINDNLRGTIDMSNLAKTYVTYLRCATVAAILAITATVVIRNFYIAIAWA